MRITGFVNIPITVLNASISNQSKLIFCHLLAFYPDNPSYRDIHNITGYGPKTISKAIKELESHKFIEVIRPSNPLRGANKYVFPDKPCTDPVYYLKQMMKRYYA